MRTAISEPGAALSTAARRNAEQRFGADFSRVRIHTGPDAASSARSLNAAAYTAGSHIVFGPGRYAPDTRPGRRLLTHELTHVAQQTRNGHVVVARQPESRQPTETDAQVSLGALDSSVATSVGEAVAGEAGWAIGREFLRGLLGGMRSIAPKQMRRIARKFADLGVRNAARYAGGLMVGIVLGLASGVWGLIEAVWTLIKLPYLVGRFTFVTLPKMAVKYASRLRQALDEGGGIRTMAADLLRNPVETWKALRSLVEFVKRTALAKVRSLGRGAAKGILAFLEKDWYEFGRSIGRVVGQVLLEIVLLVASSAVGNVVKAAAQIAGRLAARAITSIAQLVRTVGRLLGRAVVWLQTIGKTMSGKAAEVFERFKALIGRLRAVMAEMLQEHAVAHTGVGGVRMPIPEPKGARVLESRALPPGKPPATAADLTPPKVAAKPPRTPKQAPPVKSPGTPLSGGPTLGRLRLRPRYFHRWSRGRYHVSQPVDAQLLEAARMRRAREGVRPADFDLNVASAKVEIDGKISYLAHANTPRALHSEEHLVRLLQAEKNAGRRVRLLQLYTERFPCETCRNLLYTSFARDADVFWSVRQGARANGDLQRAWSLLD